MPRGSPSSGGSPSPSSPPSSPSPAPRCSLSHCIVKMFQKSFKSLAFAKHLLDHRILSMVNENEENYSTRLDDEVARQANEFPGDLESFPPHHHHHHHHHPTNTIGSSWPSMAIGSSTEGAGGLLGTSTCPNNSPLIGGGATPTLPRAADSPSLGSSVNTRSD